MGLLGIHMNDDKQVNVLGGPRVDDLNYLRSLIPNLSNDARYLGGRHTEGAGCRIEVAARLDAMRKAWYSLQAVWKANVALDFLTTIYKCCVLGAAVSGMESCTGYHKPVSKEDLAPLQHFMNGNLKTLLKGQATVKTTLTDVNGFTSTSYRARPIPALLRDCNLAPVHLELRVRRLHWLQSLLTFSDHHEIMLVSLFGHLLGASSPIKEDGAIDANFAHPWRVH